jgi:D-sedoheptulose 7-phosphate isomerase
MGELYFDKYFELLNSRLRFVNPEDLISIVDLLRKVKDSGCKVIVAGNGGSAAMSSHVSVDLVKAANIRCLNFNEADLITCFANDYGYENWVSKAIEVYADYGDLVILISSSGTSQNIINAAHQAKKMGLNLVTFSGFYKNNALSQLGAVNFWADSCSYNIVEMTHHVWLLSIIDFYIDNKKDVL